MHRRLTSEGWKAAVSRASRRFLPLGGEQLCSEARRRAGYEDFGDPAIEPALSILLNSLEAEAGLHPLGRFLMRVHLRDLLETRLRLNRFWAAQSMQVQAERIQRPVFIIGMPRSGSTFLHELLAEDPENRVPRVWEVMFPVPGKQGRGGGDLRRIRKAAACLWWFRRLAPEADAVYPMRATTPHECVAMHSYTFLSDEFISTCSIPSYENFLRSTDLTPAYAWEKRFLQHLQPRGTATRWILKSPDHVYGLEQLFSIFPDATIIQTHRNPMEVLRSSAHLTEVLRGLYGVPGDRNQIRAREARVLAEGTERFIRFRDTHPELADRFIDVKYGDLVSDPMATMRQIYAQLNLAFTPAAAERMQLLASTRSRYRGRRGAAGTGETKTETAKEAKLFERYCSRFDLSSRVPELR
jgi:hypothetical protein